jgi:LacI family transcriptional regulator/LacI family repressor for deo operon, udp, cdd, tsx, nupC, and nupG
MAATIKQVAERAGVSVATVSYVLNGTGTITEATRQRVLTAVNELHYQPHHAARSLRSRSRTLGLLLPEQPGRLADPALAEVLAGAMEAASQAGYSLLLVASDSERDPAEQAVSLIRTGRVDGLVVLEPIVDDPRANALAEARLPFICAGPVPTTSPMIALDGRAAAAIAVQHLISLEHQRIGIILLPSELADSEPRYQGYADALEEAGLEIDPQLIVEAGRTENDGYLAMQELLGLPEAPTAVLACSDELAFGALHALHDAGIDIGSDLSLIGFDDVPLAAHSNPPLTTLHQPRRVLGERLATALVDLVERRSAAPIAELIAPRLMVRRTTGRLRSMASVESSL